MIADASTLQFDVYIQVRRVPKTAAVIADDLGVRLPDVVVTLRSLQLSGLVVAEHRYASEDGDLPTVFWRLP